jgi:phosphatidylglycerol:prolipoprotein diacylglycerol transferase
MLLALSYPMIDPIAIEIGPIAIRWYALAYIAGLLIGWRVVLWHIGRQGAPPMRRNDADDFLVWAIAAVIVGGRLGYVLFYNPAFYLERPIEVVFLWQGGMSVHGGLIGVIVALIAFCRQRNLSLLPVADLITSVVPVGLFFGRIANFINAELWGRPSNVPWAFVFPNAGPAARHPSQLYEAFLEGMVLLAVLQWLYLNPKVRERQGAVAGAFLLGYAAMRIFVELFREPDGQIGFLAAGTTLGQWLSVPLVLLGGVLLVRARRAAP